jgi:NAD(P)-dependent dehydrogenase (short-subunit alcohol dehydrogenase family)
MIGGLGGIGRATALWMIERGARNLIFASRSGLSRREAGDTIIALQAKGAKVEVYD